MRRRSAEGDTRRLYPRRRTTRCPGQHVRSRTGSVCLTKPAAATGRLTRMLFRTATRSLARRPALSITILVTLALGLGAQRAIFSAVDAVLLRPLPYPDADRLVS